MMALRGGEFGARSRRRHANAPGVVVKRAVAQDEERRGAGSDEPVDADAWPRADPAWTDGSEPIGPRTPVAEGDRDDAIVLAGLHADGKCHRDARPVGSLEAHDVALSHLEPCRRGRRAGRIV